MVFSPTDILIPHYIDYTKWSVIACDQYSSETEYWERVREFVGTAPSALHMIVPETYLNHPKVEEHILGVGQTAEGYLAQNIFREYPDCFIYTLRTLRDGRVRRGLVGALDLDSYSYTGEPLPILATEQTVPNRLPPRSKARLGSPLESPHIMALIDDSNCTVIERLIDAELPMLYDFPLMENSGHLTGYLVEGALAKELAAAVERLPGGILIGDGNHSLAAAKSSWEAIKRTVPKHSQARHPAKYALAELCNVYDPAIDFLAIHRVVFGTEPERFINGLKDAAGGDGDYVIRLRSEGLDESFTARNAPIGDVIDDIQKYIDEQCEKTGCTVDYIHGDDSFAELSNAPDRVGILLPAMNKADLFATVSSRGVFPRKSFSIGEAWDKRFYMECRKIK